MCFRFAPERCLTNGFVMFCSVVKSHQLLLKIPMVFGYFRTTFCENAPKVAVNDKFYKVFSLTFLEAPERCFTNGFLEFRKSAKRHQVVLDFFIIIIIILIAL